MVEPDNYEVLMNLHKVADTVETARDSLRRVIVQSLRKNFNNEEIMCLMNYKVTQKDFYEIAKIVYDECPPAVACLLAEKAVNDHKFQLSLK